MGYANGPRWSGVLFFLLLLSGADASAAQPYIDLGPMQSPLSPEMVWGYVNVEMASVDGLTQLGPYGSTLTLLGVPAAHNRLILDTGSNSALFVSEAAAELEANGIVDVGDYVEIGVSGPESYDVSAPYRYQFWGTTDTTRYTLGPDGGTQVLYNSAADIGGRLEDSVYPVPGILGMPAMTGRVTTFDMQPWMGSHDLFDIGYLDTVFSVTSPESVDHRYSVELRADPQFDPEPLEPGGPVPVWANIPFATVRGQHGDLSATGNFLLDTGANSSILSTGFATSVGLDSNNDGFFNSADDTWIADATITGVGGTTVIPVMAVERLFLPTREGVELAWGSPDSPPLIGVLDIAGLEGVFGMDMLTNTEWNIDPFDFSMVGSPNFEQLHFDFSDWDASEQGTLWLDLSPALDVVVPEPEPWQMLLTASVVLFALAWRGWRRSAKQRLA